MDLVPTLEFGVGGAPLGTETSRALIGHRSGIGAESGWGQLAPDST